MVFSKHQKPSQEFLFLFFQLFHITFSTMYSKHVWKLTSGMYGRCLPVCVEVVFLFVWKLSSKCVVLGCVCIFRFVWKLTSGMCGSWLPVCVEVVFRFVWKLYSCWCVFLFRLVCFRLPVDATINHCNNRTKQPYKTKQSVQQSMQLNATINATVNQATKTKQPNETKQPSNAKASNNERNNQYNIQSTKQCNAKQSKHNNTKQRIQKLIQ